jgi:hypothetical protein
MFAKILNSLKDRGKKAIGFVRGLNGDKAASFIGEMADFVTSSIPFIGKYASGVARTYLDSKKALIAKKINKQLDRLADIKREKYYYNPEKRQRYLSKQRSPLLETPTVESEIISPKEDLYTSNPGTFN